MINKVMKEELCMEVERWKQGNLKLSSNKSMEEVHPGDLVMLRRSNKHDPPQIGLVLSLENHRQGATVRLQTGFCLATSVGSLIPVASCKVESRLANGGNRQEKQGIMANKIGWKFTHLISS